MASLVSRFSSILIGSTSDPDLGFIRDEDMWFSDGTIILRAEHMIFRVYTGVLSKASSVFEDMLSADNMRQKEIIEGCPLVFMEDDTAADMRTFLQTLHASPARYLRHPPFFSMTNVLVVLLGREGPRSAQLPEFYQYFGSARNTRSRTYNSWPLKLCRHGFRQICIHSKCYPQSRTRSPPSRAPWRSQMWLGRQMRAFYCPPLSSGV